MAHSVSLSWTASTDSVDGYNVYRGSAAGQETSKLTATPVTGTTFVDSAPALGNDFYVARSIKNGIESVNSNEVSVVILPAPPSALAVTEAS